MDRVQFGDGIIIERNACPMAVLKGDLNALRVGGIDLGARRVAGSTNSSGGEQINLR